MANIIANIQKILSVFDHYVSLLENEIWLKNATSESIISSFKCAAFVEKTIEHCKINNNTKQLLSTLTASWKDRNRTVEYDENFYTVACDNLLGKYFISNFTSTVSVDTAIRMYVAVNSKERLEKFFEEFLLKSVSYEAILNYSMINKEKINVDELEISLKLDLWVEDFKRGKADEVKESIESLLSSYNIDKILYVLISIIGLKSNYTDQKAVQDLIMQILEPKMSDQSGLSKKYWLSLLKNIDRIRIVAACVNNQVFMDLLIDIVTYQLTMLVYDNDQWVTDADTVCPEITYSDLIGMFKVLLETTDVREHVISKISEAKNSIGTPIWFEIHKQYCCV